MRTFKLVVVSVLVLGCGKGGGGGNSWATKPLKTVTDTASGVAFSIDLPDGLAKDKELSSELGPAWKTATGDELESPSFSVRLESIPPKTPDELAKREVSGKEFAGRKEVIPGGMIVTVESPKKGLVSVTVEKMTGDKALTCSASQANDDGLPDYDATKAWLEKICLSLKIS